MNTDRSVSAYCLFLFIEPVFFVVTTDVPGCFSFSLSFMRLGQFWFMGRFSNYRLEFNAFAMYASTHDRFLCSF